jgi:hypothetical protein
VSNIIPFAPGLFTENDQNIAHAGKAPVFLSNDKGEFRVYLPSMRTNKRGHKGILLCKKCL